MADESIEDGEFWLPPQFLEEGLGWEDSDSSDLCSQVESMAGSGEDWSDEEDCLADLRMKMALSSVEDDCQKLDYEKYKVRWPFLSLLLYHKECLFIVILIWGCRVFRACSVLVHRNRPSVESAVAVATGRDCLRPPCMCSAMTVVKSAP